MIHGEIAKLSNKYVRLSEQMDSAECTFKYIRVLFNLFRHRSNRLSKRGDIRLKGPFRTDMNRKADIPTDNHGPLNVILIYEDHQLFSALPNPDLIHFQTCPFCYFTASCKQGERFAHFSFSIRLSIFIYGRKCDLPRSLGHYYSGAQTQEVI